MFSILKNFYFFKMAESFYIALTMYEDSKFLNYCQYLLLVLFLYNCYSSECEEVSNCGLDLHFCND